MTAPLPDDEALRSLRAAALESPANVPIRQLLGDALLLRGLAAEAEREYRDALALAPDHAAVKLGLARAFAAQEKHSHALALVETLVGGSDPNARALVLHAQLLAGIGEIAMAVKQYQRGVAKDRLAADPVLAARLGIDATEDDASVVDGRVRASWEGGEGDDDAPAIEVERSSISFKDVGGMDKLKEEIELKIIHPLTHRDLYAAYGKRAGGGILMYGPPGCGKTHLARATAGEIRAGFIAVGIHEVLDMWIGNSEKNLHGIFEQARRNRPCVLFFDEVDALGASRSDMRQSAGRHLINQFLAELDGATADNEGVLVLGATNAPWHLDSAFRRPGRFDRILFVPPPDAAARAAILRLQCAGKPQDGVDFDAVAKKTDAFSGADLKAVVDQAVEAKLREAMKAGIPTPLRTKDLLAAAGGLRPTTKEWFASARNHALYANQGGLYDDILKYLGIEGGRK